MWPLVADVAWSVFVCVDVSNCLLVTPASCSKTDELIVMPFGMSTWVGPRNRVQDSPPQEKGLLVDISRPIIKYE